MTSPEDNRRAKRLAFRDQDGAALVEFTLVLPLLLLLMIGMLEFGRVFNYWIDETHLANAAARWAAVDRNPGPGGSLQESIQQQADTDELRNGGTASVPAGAQVCIALPDGTLRRRRPRRGDGERRLQLDAFDRRRARRGHHDHPDRLGDDAARGAAERVQRRLLVRAAGQRSMFGSEDGGALVMAVIWLPILLLIVVLVVDVGNWFAHAATCRRRRTPRRWRRRGTSRFPATTPPSSRRPASTPATRRPVSTSSSAAPRPTKRTWS